MVPGTTLLNGSSRMAHLVEPTVPVWLPVERNFLTGITERIGQQSAQKQDAQAEGIQRRKQRQ